jgi:hypothetical protein
VREHPANHEEPVMEYDIMVLIDYLTLLQKVNPNAKDCTGIETRLAKLKYVTAAWINHRCVVTANLETSDVVVADRRIKELMGKIERLINRYRPRK